MIEQQAQMIELLKRLASKPQGRVPAPRLTGDITRFSDYDWERQGIEVLELDVQGPTRVEWNNREFRRRSVSNKFGKAIMFSDAIGKKEDGSTDYDTLIIFKEIPPVDKLDRDVAEIAR
jgi:hypothetical protein